MTIIMIDGVRVKLQPPDLDGDGQRGGIENLTASMPGQTDIIQPSELGEVVKEFNSDVIEPHTRMSTIDMKSRLHWSEINSVLAMDTLVALGMCTKKCLSFTRQKKRLNVSLDGLGRKENVELVVGKREQDRQQVMPQQGSGGVFGMFGFNKNNKGEEK